MTLSLTDKEYRMLQVLALKGLDSMKSKLGNYSDLSLPTYFRNTCKEEMQHYEELANRLNSGMGLRAYVS